jgi:HNH endonuclease
LRLWLECKGPHGRASAGRISGGTPQWSSFIYDTLGLMVMAWNRYSYVINNPLAFTDPNGYCFLGLCGAWNAIGTFIDRTIGSALRAYPLLGSVIQIGAAAICGTTLVICPLVVGLTAAAVAGITTGRLDVALKSGLIAGVTALAFGQVAELTEHNPTFGSSQYLENVAGHALVGCGSAVASGAKCGPSALAGAITSGAVPFINGHGFVAGLVANTVLGGAVAVAGGGKFENGAIMGAFGYLFNACGGTHGCADLLRQLGMTGGIIGGGLFAATGEYASFGLQSPMVPAEIAGGGAIGGGFGQAIGSIIDWIYNSDDGSSGGSRRPNADTQRGADAAATDADGKLRCFYCNGELTTEAGQPNSREYDHMNPWSRGGDSSDGNIVDSCRTCNRSKGAQTPWEFGGKQ